MKISVASQLYLLLRSHLLEQINSPIVLALDEVNQIFEQPVAKIFNVTFLVRRSQKTAHLAKLPDCGSSEIYVPLQLNQSPFNVGLPIQLTGFSLEQVQQLAQCCKPTGAMGKSPATNGVVGDIPHWCT